MKENKKNFYKKIKRRYGTLYLIDAIFIIIHLATSFMIISPGPYGSLELAVGIMIFDLLFMIVRGIVSYIKYRSVVFPNLIIAGLSLVSLLIVYLITVGIPHFNTLPMQLGICCCYTVAASLISSVITMLIVKLCKLIKNKRNATAQAK